MSFLHSITDPKFTGNCQRIRELDSLGLRPDAITQEFRKQGINISINMVNAVLNGEIEQMRRKALPKSVVQEKKRNIDLITESITA